MKNVLQGLPKRVLIPLRLTAAASATDAVIHEKMFGCGMATLITSNKEIDNFLEIVKSFKQSCLLTRGLSETIKNAPKEEKGRFLGVLLGTLGASLLGNLLTGKDTVRAGEGTIRGGQDL